MKYVSDTNLNSFFQKLKQLFAKKSDVPSQADLDSRYLQLSGGTMTGDITMTSKSIKANNISVFETGNGSTSAPAVGNQSINANMLLKTGTGYELLHQTGNGNATILSTRNTSANPTLAGTEANLDSLKVNGTSYKLGYLPTSGGTMSGYITMPYSTGIKSNNGTTVFNVENDSSGVYVGSTTSASSNVKLITGEQGHAYHKKGNTDYEILDESNEMTDEDVDMLFIEKGTILKMNLDGTERQYRVLKNVSGSVFEVLGMFSTGSVHFSSSQSSTDTFADGSVGQKYAGETLDIALNTTWYNTLSSAAKEAIVDKNIVQDMWRADGNGNPSYYGMESSQYRISLQSGATLAIGDRHVYALSVQDVIDYLDVTPQMHSYNTTLTGENLKEMFFGTETAFTAWFRSANTSANPSVTDNVTGLRTSVQAPYIGTTWRGNSNTAAVPAFQIDLSKITYTEV